MKAPDLLRSHRPLLKCLQISTVAILFLLGGCGVMNQKIMPSAKVYLTKTLQWQLPAIALLPAGNYVLTQSVQATYGNSTVDLLFQIEKQPDRLAMAALTPAGQPLVQLVYDNHQVTGHLNPLVPAELSLSYLVSDFLLAYGRLESLAGTLDKYHVILQQQGQNRIFQYQEEPIISIQYSRGTVASSKDQWPGNVELHNQALGYRLSIQTLSYSSL